ncbi:MAG TPA: hypothetical protein VGC06_22960 [Actinomycetes bacterium]
MKQQYFGDARDYFKYDVLDRLASDLAGIERLTCLWMLSAPDYTGQGRVPFTGDPELPELTEFFRERLASNDPARRRVGEMGSYFANRPFALVSYRDDREDFGPGTRAEYFARVPDKALRRAVVFFDPDIGMEPGRATAKHLRFDELGDILSRMDSTSVAVVFQYCRRVTDCWELIASQLAGRLGCPVAYIAEAVLAFYVIAQTRSRLAEVVGVLERIADRHTPGAPGTRIVRVSDR